MIRTSRQRCCRLQFAVTVILFSITGLPLISNGAFGQAQPPSSSRIASALAAARSVSTTVDAVDVVTLSNAGSTEAIPALEQQFRRAQKESEKLYIAAGLVRLKDNNEAYWSFLLKTAENAVNDDIPTPLYTDSSGVTTLRSPELQAWADAHGMSSDAAASLALRDHPAKLLALATSTDPRAIPLLRQALHSQNLLIATIAAKELVQLQDKPSISVIEEAASVAPAGYGAAIVEPLIFMDDPEAQRAVQHYVPKDRASALRQARANGMRVFGP